MKIGTKKSSGVMNGFSLIELAIAMAMVGLFTASALETYRVYSKQRLMQVTEWNGLVVQKAMTRFYNEFGRLPCPADPTVALGSTGAGVESCSYPSSGSCSSGTKGICVFPSQRDSDSDGVKDPIAMGSVPYATLGITAKQSYDGWGRRLSYAVTARETVQLTYSADGGGVDIITAGPTPKSPDALINRYYYKFVILSHGSDGKGSYYPSGVQIPCGTVELDQENCDRDDQFVMVSGVNDMGTPADGSDDVVVNYRSTKEGATFYDDYILRYDLDSTSDYWVYIQDSAATLPTNIGNVSNGNVGINNEHPEKNLDVVGSIKAQLSRAVEYCDSDGGNCFRTQTIAGPVGIGCAGADGGMSGVANDGPVCPNYIGTTAIPAKNCASYTQWAIGVDATGGLICATIP